MDALFAITTNFPSLSLKDLAEARDLFHYHLMNKKNVVATALLGSRAWTGAAFEAPKLSTVA
jgi:hypothetical protein